MSILDEIVLTSCPFHRLSPLPSHGASNGNAVRFSRTGDYGQDHQCELVTPWIVCNENPKSLKQFWIPLCQQLRESGVPVECSNDSLSQLPASALPNRISRVDIDQPLRLADTAGACLIELTCRSARRGQWGWPPEAGDASLLDAWLQSVRMALGTAAPVGLGIPCHVDDPALRQVASLDIDWLSLHPGEMGTPETMVRLLVRLSEILKDARRSELPILARTSISKPEHAVKWIALGASLVSIAPLLQPAESPTNEPSAGYLSQVQIKRPDPPEKPFSTAIEKLNTQLNNLVNSAFAESRNDLKSKLRATTSRAAQIARIPMIGEAQD